MPSTAPSDAEIESAERLIVDGRAAEALVRIEPWAAADDAPHAVLVAHALALKALGRTGDALVVHRRASERFPRSGVAWHNLAATLGDLGRGAESQGAAEHAFSLGLDAPQTWSVMARALLSQGEHERAEDAYRQVLRRAPGDLDTAIELANFIWVRKGDAPAAQAVLDAAFRGGASPAGLLIAKAKLMEAAGDDRGAAGLLAAGIERLPPDIPLLLAAVQAAIELGSLERAGGWLATAERLGGDRPEVINQAIILHLAAGEPQAAMAAARRGLALAPDNQSLIGWAATAARAAGDPLYETLYDYDQMVRPYDVPTPAAWPSQAAFLGDLASALRRRHVFAQHPFNQSLREGSQTMDVLTGSDDPAIQSFFQAIDGPIRAYMAAIGQGDDPLRRRNSGDYRIDSAWSVLLRPGGHHRDHFHPRGWLSSAFYVETPDRALDTPDHQGWIRFGRPPSPTRPQMPAAHEVRPAPGRLVLFPSYMWHGTVPFTTEEPRLTIAFDVVPA